MSKTTTPFERIADELLDSLPRFTPAEQRLAHAIYHRLAEGRPVRHERLAADLGIPTPEVSETMATASLNSLTFTDDQDRIIGFCGLAVTGNLPHLFRVNGQNLYTWCAWDSLFLPPILHTTAHVISRPPGGDEPVRLVVGPTGIESVTPETAVLSFILPTAEMFDGDVHKAMAAFCHYVYFFPDRETGEAWTAAKPGTFLLSLEEGLPWGN